MSNRLIFIMTDDYKRYWGYFNKPLYAFDLNDKGFYDYQRQTDLIVTNGNNKQTCTKPFVFIWPITNDRVERYRQYTSIHEITYKQKWLDFATNYGYWNLLPLYSWTYDFDKSSERNKEETLFEEKYLKVNNNSFRTVYPNNEANDFKKFFIKFLQGGGV